MGQPRSFFWQCLGVVLGVALIAAACGLFVSLDAAVGALVAGVFCFLVFLVISWRRHRQVSNLASEIDQVLHDGRRITFSDCTEGDIAILRNELEKMVAKLSRTTAMLEDEKLYLAHSLEDISHQIRTPLTAISLMIPALETEQDSRARKHMLMELEHMIERLSWLVTTLLKMAKFETGSYALECLDTPVQRVINRAVDPLRMAMDLHEISLEEDIPLQCSMVMDARWMAEAISNIVKNCLEHTPDGGSIVVQAQEDTLATHITVTDSGPGISAEDLPHIFERFYRGKDATEEEKAQGFGIGLALAQAIVSAHDGSIRVDNAPEGGARFLLAFPKVAV